MNEATRVNPVRTGVLIGLDWAKHKHDYCLLTPEGLYEHGQVEHDDEKLQWWLDDLSGRFAGHRLQLCMEGGRHPLLWRIENHPNVDLFVVNPATAAKYRKTFAPSGDKNDRRDAASLLDLLRVHPEKVRAHRPADPATRVLHTLTIARRHAVNRRTAVIASLREVFELHYPVASKLFDDLSAPLALAFLKRWPDPLSLSKARESTLLDFFHRHRSRSKTLINKRLALIARSRCEYEDPGLRQVARMQVIEHLEQITTSNKSIAEYEKLIERTFAEHEKAFLFARLPGAGEHLAPRLLAAFVLLDPKDATEMQTMVGIAPIRRQSGQSMRTFMRERCPKFLRQSFHEFAGCSIEKSAWAKAFYEQKKAKTTRHATQTAKRALAYKWIRILVACWRSNRPYDEMEYLTALQRRNSPIADLVFAN